MTHRHCGYLPNYQIIYYLMTEAHVCEQLANRSLYESGTAGSRTVAA